MKTRALILTALAILFITNSDLLSSPERNSAAVEGADMIREIRESHTDSAR